MSKQPQVEEPQPHGAPRWYVGFSTLTTILMTFFITLTVSMGEKRDLGYAGPGAGEFRKAFNSHGVPGVLRGARRLLHLFSFGHYYSSEESGPSGQNEVYAGRLPEAPEHNLKHALTELAPAPDEFVLPVSIRYGDRLDARSREHLSAAARALRQTDHFVIVRAAVPRGRESTQDALCRATEWALLITRYLSESEKIPSARLMAVGQIALPGLKDKLREPMVMLIMRPQTPKDAVPAAAQARRTDPFVSAEGIH